MGRKKTEIQRTEKSEGLDITLQEIVDGWEDELLVIDDEYRVGFANSAVRGRYCDGAELPVGEFCYKVFHHREKPCSTPLWECPLRKVWQTGRATSVIHKDNVMGLDRYIRIMAYPLKDTYGNVKAVVEVKRDVTAERELEIQTLKRHHQLLALSNISSAVSELWDLDAMLRIAFNNVLEIVNGAVGGILLLDEETETLYYHTQHGLSAKYAEEMRMNLGEGIAGRVAQTGQSMLLEDVSRDPRAARPDLINAEGLKGCVSIPIKAKDKVIGVMNVVSTMAGRFGADDVSLLSSICDYLGTAIERAKLYERLEMASQRYQALLRHALTAQEQERKRIARELHDETSQALTSLTLSLQAILGMAEMKGIKDVDLIEKIKATHSYAVRAGTEVVQLMKELRPTLLDELGLPAAIHRYAKDTLQAKGINVSAEFEGTDKRLTPEIEVTLFRIAQGAIGNILEHSEAENASVKLKCDASECLLRISDDGKGFDVSKITRVDSSGRGAGVFTMKERVKLIGGVCHIDSGPGKGTQVVVNVPLEKDIIDEKDKGTDSR